MNTIASTNKFFSSALKKRKMIVNAVHNSAKVEGSKITKKELKIHYDKGFSNVKIKNEKTK
ncbi:hypothetical protein OZZ08_10165 [Malaciobacter mytili]|uniref:hypothetical protein n=1 Tax=Malaciobacter mytili TaxID=603050 RepID=UPI003BAEC9C5